MRGRTALTGAGEATPELYSPAFAIPTEPRVPPRWQRPAVVAAAVLTVVGLLYGGWRLANAGASFDPALTDVPTAPASPAAP